MSASLVFSFPVNATFEQVTAAIALHFGGTPTNLSTGQDDESLRDATAVFTGAAVVASASTHTISTGAGAPTLDLDAEGLPWDERIHSSTKAKNADGNWKLRKGMGNSAQLPAIKAELRQRVHASGAVPVHAVTSGVPTLPAETANLHNQSDEAQKARLAYAHEQAVIIAGPMNLLTQEQFDKLKRGVLVEVLPAGLAWFRTYQEAFNGSYAQYAAGTLTATEAAMAGTVHMNTQAINPNAPAGIVQIAGAAQAPSTPVAPPPAADAPIVDFPSFAVKYAGTDAAILNEVMTPLGIAGGLAGLAAQPAMIPAVVAMLKSRGL